MLYSRNGLVSSHPLSIPEPLNLPLLVSISDSLGIIIRIAIRKMYGIIESRVVNAGLPRGYPTADGYWTGECPDKPNYYRANQCSWNGANRAQDNDGE